MQQKYHSFELFFSGEGKKNGAINRNRNTGEKRKPEYSVIHGQVACLYLITSNEPKFSM